jgi:hypothetical protein
MSLCCLPACHCERHSQQPDPVACTWSIKVSLLKTCSTYSLYTGPVPISGVTVCDHGVLGNLLQRLATTSPHYLIISNRVYSRPRWVWGFCSYSQVYRTMICMRPQCTVTQNCWRCLCCVKRGGWLICLLERGSWFKASAISRLYATS